MSNGIFLKLFRAPDGGVDLCSEGGWNLHFGRGVDVLGKLGHIFPDRSILIGPTGVTIAEKENKRKSHTDSPEEEHLPIDGKFPTISLKRYLRYRDANGQLNQRNAVTFDILLSHVKNDEILYRVSVCKDSQFDKRENVYSRWYRIGRGVSAMQRKNAPVMQIVLDDLFEYSRLNKESLSFIKKILKRGGYYFANGEQ